jgi:hypothetical protein
MASVPSSLKGDSSLDGVLDSLKMSVESLPRAFKDSLSSPFVPRPLLFLFAYTAAALYILEHTIWASHNGGITSDWTTHASVFKRWVQEGLDVAYTEMARAQALTELGERHKENLNIVYNGGGSVSQAKL